MNSERDFSAAASSSAILDEKVLVATFDGLVTPEYRLFFCLFVFFVFVFGFYQKDVSL